MTARTPARRRSPELDDLDRAIANAEARTIVVWRGTHLALAEVPEQLARISVREGRELLYGSYVEALEALNPLYARRLSAWLEGGEATEADHGDPAVFVEDLARLDLEAETPYYAALRRYLALIGIEQGDASEADLWHVLRGSSWAHWFGEREVERAVTAARRELTDSVRGMDGWRAAEAHLAGIPAAADLTVGVAIGRAYASLVGAPEWLADALRVDVEGAGHFVDFAAFVRLWRIRRHVALLTYERRLYEADDPALQRAYYAGIVGHQTGVAVAEAGYLASVPHPYASADDLRATILGAMLVEELERHHGLHWWQETASRKLVDQLAGAPTMADAIAELGYDALDWRPVLRQIRTRLVGEMSGYGGPNITTRAGTRKV
ncbi:MAG TPA: hypothetical protein VIH24_00925 [Candidatus Limnocylindria bacterium]